MPAAGIAASTDLVTFDSSAPSDVRVRAITGLQTATESAIGIDTRPATGELFVLTVPVGSVASATIRTYKVDPVTAEATVVGSLLTLTGAGDRPTGLDFNPLVDRIRVVQSNNESGRINPTNGALAGNAGSGQNGCPPSVGDDTAPTITLRGAPSRVTRKRFFAGIASRISVNEASSLEVALLGRARSARLARAGDIVLAERRLRMSAATRSVRLKPKRGLLARRRRSASGCG